MGPHELPWDPSTSMGPHQVRPAVADTFDSIAAGDGAIGAAQLSGWLDAQPPPDPPGSGWGREPGSA